MMAKSKLAPHLKAITKAIEGGEPTTSVAKRYGVPRTTLRSFMESNNINPPNLLPKLDPQPAAKISDPTDELVLMKQERDEWRAAYNKRAKTEGLNERIFKQLEEAVEAPRQKFKPTAKSKPMSEHEHTLILSDFHAGEVVDPAGVSGLNEYNWDIMEQRLEGVYQALLSFQENRPYPIKHLNMWWLGDMCSGSNHRELAETNEMPLAEQGLKVGYLLGELTEKLTEHYDSIHVAGVAGNHPRLNKEPANKQVFNNFDWVAYKTAELYFRNYDQVTTNFPNSGFAIEEVAGKTYLLFHGDGIRSSMPGVPWGGVARRANELTRSYMDRQVKLDGFVIGHFHTPNVIEGGRIIVNGSLKGTDEYVLKNFGANSPPTQLLLTHNRKAKRLTDVSYITL